MFKKLQNLYYRKQLKDKRFDFLFDKDTTGEYVVFDTETSGLNPEKDEILSIGAVKVRDNKILLNEKFVLFLKPTKEINQESIKIHRLRHCDLDYAMDATQAIEKFLYFIGSRTLVGYYLEFDIAMINKYLIKIMGIKLPNETIEISGIYHDKKIQLIPQGTIDLKFDTIMKDLDLPIFGKHDSFNDALMSAMAFVKLKSLSAYEKLNDYR